MNISTRDIHVERPHTAAAPLAPSTLVELLRWRAREEGARVAYTFLMDGEEEASSVTYGDLDRQAMAIGAGLQDLLRPGERAVLMYPPGLDYIAAFLGCLYAGVVAVPVYPPEPSRLQRTLPRFEAIIADAQAAAILTMRDLLPAAAEFLAPSLGNGGGSPLWIATDDLVSCPAERWREPALGRDSLAFLQYTSGSTGRPSGVMVSHGNVLHQQALLQVTAEATRRSILVGWLPPYHDMGLIGTILQPLCAGYPSVLMPPTSFLRRPFRWLQAISRYGATISVAPNFAYDLCVRRVTPEERRTLDLRRWRAALNGAEPVSAETMERFAAAFSECGFQHSAFFPTYGLAEATLMVAGGPVAAPPRVRTLAGSALERHLVVPAAPGDADARALVGCGQIHPDLRVAVADPETLRECATGTVGEILVSGPSVTQGYWGRPEATAQAFGARLASSGEGPFLRTGDLGFLTDGELFVTGRLKDLIIIRGRNHYPQDIEHTVERSHPALRSGCGAAFAIEAGGEEQLAVVYEIEVRAREDLDLDGVAKAIRAAIAEEHDVQLHALALIEPRSIPKTSSGKIQRHACRAGLLAGNLPAIAAWTGLTLVAGGEPGREGAAGRESEMAQEAACEAAGAPPGEAAIRDWLVTHLAELRSVAPEAIAPGEPFVNLGVDSAEAALLSWDLEWLGRPVPLVLIWDYPTVDALALHLASGDESVTGQSGNAGAMMTSAQ